MQGIAIVGPGRLGSALAKYLDSYGYRVSELITREAAKSLRNARALAGAIKARVSTISTAHLDADIIWFCVPDSVIASTAHKLETRTWNRKIAFHSSGVLPSDVLGPLRAQGASVASVHPLMTFIPSSLPDLKQVSFALEGDHRAVQAANRIVRKLGASPILIRPDAKLAYHAFATLVCPLLVSLLAVGEQAASLANIPAREARRRMLPIVRQTLANFEKFGPDQSFTGPIVRGDAETVRMHLRAFAHDPEIQKVYRALASAALNYLPTRNASGLKELLDRPTQRTVRRSVEGKGRASRRSVRQN